MSTIALLVLGLGLGLRHATDADHLLAVSTLVRQELDGWRAVRVAVLWGSGHTLAFLALGLLVVLTGTRIPPSFEQGAQFVVGAMLVGLGVWSVVSRRSGSDIVPMSTPTRPSARPLAVGLVHGLAGSAGVALVAATTMKSTARAIAYLGLVALGTVVGMVALTLALARSLRWAHHRAPRSTQALSTLGAGLSVALGIFTLLQLAATSDGAVAH